MTINRAVIRRQLAALLTERLNAIVERIYEYQASDFKGASPVVIVTNSGTERGNQAVAVESTIYLEVHTFVLYALPPVRAVADVTSTTILLGDTSMFSIGQVVTLEDDVHDEQATIVNMDASSIEVDFLAYTYTTPNVFVWTEAQSEDQIDDIEYQIADEVRLANEADIWLSIAIGDRSNVDVVEIGGEAYRHETISVNALVEDF